MIYAGTPLGSEDKFNWEKLVGRELLKMATKDVDYQVLEKGDIIFVSLNPPKGHEQIGSILYCANKKDYLFKLYVRISGYNF